MKETTKIPLHANFISRKCLKFTSRCLEIILADLVKYTYREVWSVLILLQKVY